MNEILKEWVVKAEGDYETALREYRARCKPNPDAVCFHAQQCVEKYLKAELQRNGIPFPRIHDLSQLLSLCLPRHPLWDSMRPGLTALTRFAVLFRYPGEFATRAEAMEAMATMRSVRIEIRQALGLQTTKDIPRKVDCRRRC